MIDFTRNVLKNKFGTALFMALLILSGVLAVSLGVASLLISGAKMSRGQAHSTKAYFATEAGIERSLWEVRKGSYSLPDIDEDNIFYGTLGNNSAYQVDYASSTPYIHFISTGSFQDTNRSIQVTYQSN